MFFLFRVLKIAINSDDDFAALMSVGLGFSIVSQAFINMSVAVNLLPVTGQTLPLISAGGSSVWMTCAAIGLILSISHDNHLKKENLADEKETIFN